MSSPASLPRVLLLDLDDTILDDTGARDRCWTQACAEAAERDPGLDATELRHTVERVRDAFWADPERHRLWRGRMRDAWVRIAGDALAELGVRDEPLARFIGDRHFTLRDAAIAPLPGAVAALHRLAGAGVTLGLITNGGSEGQRAKIERFALAAHFAYIGIEGEVGFGKPHRRAYEAALAGLSATPAECWMVGDNLEWDVAGAQAVGIRGIWLDKQGSGVPAGSPVIPDAVIRSVGELVPA